MAEEQGAAIAEIPEVTEPESAGATEEVEKSEPTDPTNGVDEQTGADVPQGKKSQDSAFAEMRRGREESERQLEALKAELEQARSQIGEYNRQAKQSELMRTAEGLGLSDEEIQQVLADADEADRDQQERDQMQSEYQAVQEELMNVRIDQAMEKDLSDIQKIDPEIQSLEDLPEDFFTYRASMDGLDAYFACKAKEQRLAFEGAKSTGKVNASPINRDYYTSEEIDNLSDDEIKKNWDKVQKSIDRL